MHRTLEMIIRELEARVEELEADLEANRKYHKEEFSFVEKRLTEGGNGFFFGHADDAYDSALNSGRSIENFCQRELRYHELRNLLIDLKLTPE